MSRSTGRSALLEPRQQASGGSGSWGQGSGSSLAPQTPTLPEGGAARRIEGEAGLQWPAHGLQTQARVCQQHAGGVVLPSQEVAPQESCCAAPPWQGGLPPPPTPPLQQQWRQHFSLHSSTHQRHRGSGRFSGVAQWRAAAETGQRSYDASRSPTACTVRVVAGSRGQLERRVVMAGDAAALPSADACVEESGGADFQQTPPLADWSSNNGTPPASAASSAPLALGLAASSVTSSGLASSDAKPHVAPWMFQPELGRTKQRAALQREISSPSMLAPHTWHHRHLHHGKSSMGSSPGSGGIPPEVAAVLQRRFSSLLCPITLEPFQEPVVAADGNTYERRAIEEWLYREGRDTSPLTNKLLAHKLLMPCQTMKLCVEEAAAYIRAVQQQVL